MRNDAMLLTSTHTRNGKDQKDGIPENEAEDGEEDEEEGKGISRIQVPRQKYIPVSKAELLDGIVLSMFRSQDEDEDDDEIKQFLLLSS